MTTRMKNPDKYGNYETKYNSDEFRKPEFKVEVQTSFGVYVLDVYNMFDRGFSVEHEFITNTLANSRETLEQAVEQATSKLENGLDTMT